MIRPRWGKDTRNPLVYAWWLAECAPGVLPAERLFVRVAYAVRAPRVTVAGWRKRRSIPAVGQVLCHGEPKTVAGHHPADPDRLVVEFANPRFRAR